MKKICTVLAAVTLIVAIVAACGGSGGSSYATDSASSSAAAASETPTATGAAITIEGMAFGEPLTVAPGAEVRIVNNDSVEHSVSSETAGAFDVEVDGQQKGTLTAPTTPGQYQYHCKYHPSMKGTLIVE